MSARPLHALREAEREAKMIASDEGHDLHPIPAEIPRTQGVCKVCGWAIRIRVYATEPDGLYHYELDFAEGVCPGDL